MWTSSSVTQLEGPESLISTASKGQPFVTSVSSSMEQPTSLVVKASDPKLDKFPKIKAFLFKKEEEYEANAFGYLGADSSSVLTQPTSSLDQDQYANNASVYTKNSDEEATNSNHLPYQEHDAEGSETSALTVDTQPKDLEEFNIDSYGQAPMSGTLQISTHRHKVKNEDSQSSPKSNSTSFIFNHGELDDLLNSRKLELQRRINLVPKLREKLLNEILPPGLNRHTTNPVSQFTTPGASPHTTPRSISLISSTPKKYRKGKNVLIEDETSDETASMPGKYRYVQSDKVLHEDHGIEVIPFSKRYKNIEKDKGDGRFAFRTIIFYSLFIFLSGWVSSRTYLKEENLSILFSKILSSRSKLYLHTPHLQRFIEKKEKKLYVTTKTEQQFLLNDPKRTDESNYKPIDSNWHVSSRPYPMHTQPLANWKFVKIQSIIDKVSLIMKPTLDRLSRITKLTIDRVRSLTFKLINAFMVFGKDTKLEKIFQVVSRALSLLTKNLLRYFNHRATVISLLAIGLSLFPLQFYILKVQHLERIILALITIP